MVKFGRHQKFFLDHEHPDTYIVPYNDAKTNIEEDCISEEDFQVQWRAYLEHAREEFDASLQLVWRRVFSTLSLHAEEVRGAPPEKALVLFTQHAPAEEVQEVLTAFKSLHASALVNAEALRKLVKKFDKKQNQQDNNNLELGGGENIIESFNKETKTAEQDQQQQLATDACSTSLSCKLLPEVYAANFVIGLSALQQGTELLRSELGIGEYADTNAAPQSSASSPPTQQNHDARTYNHNAGHEPTFSFQNHHQSEGSIGMTIDVSHSEGLDHLDHDPIHNNLYIQHQHIAEKLPPRPEKEEDQPHTFTMLTKDDRKDSHSEHLELVFRRRQERLWLKHSVDRIDQLKMLPSLVAHRGFHSPQDRSDRRPMENSLQAYESAWTSGIHLCECDIALTKDEKLILAHDEDFSRLALDASCEKSTRIVRDLTFPEIMSVALKSGCRPPLLLDVLQSAHAIGGHSQLIIEIKPGNREAASAVARLFGQYPHLMAHCAVVMSFDSFAMHSLQDEMDAIFGTRNNDDPGTPSMGHKRSFSMGILPVPSLSHMEGPHSPRATRHPRPKLLVLTVSDEPKREVELQVSIDDEKPLEKIQGWIKGRLDGVYMQFEPNMLTPKGSDALQKLTRRFHVGIWGYNGRDPDHYHTSSNLVQQGHVSYVNTDLPRDFFLPHEPVKRHLS